MTGTTRQGLGGRFAHLARAMAMIGPPTFLILYAARAVNPFDPTLVAIAAALAVVTVALLRRHRWAGFAYILFPVAVFSSPAIRELSFNLTAAGAGPWRWWAIAALVSLGVATATALVVASGATEFSAWSGALVGGSVLGALLLLIAPVVSRQPAFGRDLTDEELAALPVIDLLNYRYEPALLTVEATGTQWFRLDNPSSLPHTVTVESLDLEVWVPAGRWAVLELDADKLADPVAFYCSVGDHRDLGMSGLIEVR